MRFYPFLTLNETSCFNPQFSAIEAEVMEQTESIKKVKRQRTYFEYPAGTEITYVNRYIELVHNMCTQTI